MNGVGEHSSLLQYDSNGGCKSFIVQGPMLYKTVRP